MKTHGLTYRITFLLLLVAAAVLTPATAQDTVALRFTRAVVISHHVGDLCWNRLPAAQQYELYRRFPDHSTFTLIATIPDTHFTDTLHRIVCADTVSYTLLARDTTLLPIPSDTAGLYYQDNIPTSPCSLRLCSVDTILNRVRLSWYPSPDTDVMGYYICMGSPCRDYDTVWGRLNTEYICREDLSVDENRNAQFSFRILAFDSCFQASPLTPYYHNPVLRLHAEPCSRQLQCTWNRYINMPDSVSAYRLFYRLDDDPVWHSFRTGPEGPFVFDTLIADLAVRQLTAYIAACSPTDSLMALSGVQTFHFDNADTASYARILAAHFDEAAVAARLDLEVDPDFSGATVLIMRRTIKDTTDPPSPFVQVAQLTRTLSPSPQQYLTYTDTDLQRTAYAYVYRLDIPDICNYRSVSSDTVWLTLPPVGEAVAYFPNVIKGGDPELGRFCPSIISPSGNGYRLDIFNRVGERVYHTTRLTDCWDGTTPAGKHLPQGTYVYHVQCRHTDGTVKTYTGTVLLLR